MLFKGSVAPTKFLNIAPGGHFHVMSLNTSERYPFQQMMWGWESGFRNSSRQAMDKQQRRIHYVIREMG